VPLSSCPVVAAMDGSFPGDHGGGVGEGYSAARVRRNRRNATDIGTTYVAYMHNRRGLEAPWRQFEAERLSPSYIVDILPPAARKDRPVDTLPAKLLHSSFNKLRQPVNVVRWTPDGRRLLTGSSSGEFTLWNGTGFNFETIMQAHDDAIRALTYSHNNEWLLSGDQVGVLKYWQTNFNNVQQIKAHPDSTIRDIAFAPSDSRFVTAADDNMLKLWDFANYTEISTLSGHSWDVKSADWHPTKGLIVSGSKDHTVKLWDPRSGGKCLTTLHGHKNTLTMTRFEPTNGVLLATSAREPNARVFDIRMMRDVFLLKNDGLEITSLVWHPIHSSLLSLGAYSGAMSHFLLDEQNAPASASASTSPYDSPNPSDIPSQSLWPAHKTPYAHDYAIWSMEWHPMGHILASGANDRATRFWTRPRPGDDSYLNDRWHIGVAAAEAQGTWKKAEAQRQHEEDEADDEAEGLVDQQMPTNLPGLPGLPNLPGLASRQAPALSDGLNTDAPQLLSLPSFPNGAPLPFLAATPSSADLEALKQAFGGQLPQPPMLGNIVGGSHVQSGFPPVPNFPGAPPPSQQLQPGFQPPPNFIMPSLPSSLPVVGGSQASMPASGGGGGGRKRAPLPSQKESLREEMRQGRYTKAR